MKRVDTTYWKPFPISKLFVTEKNGKQVPTGANIPKLELKEKGRTPRITVTGINNGVFGYFDYTGGKPGNYRVYENFISVSFLGTVFYQARESSLDMKVHCLKPLNHNLNEYTGEFLVAAIKAALKNYKYSDQLSSTVLPALELTLPSIDGLPDWQYMEEYMRKIEQRTKSAISAFRTSQSNPHKIDTTYWKEFEIENLFSVSRPPARLANEFEKGDIPFVASGNENNGVEKYVAAKNEILDKKGCISVSPVDGSCFYQPYDFLGRGGAGSSIILLRNARINQYNAFFVCSVLRKVCSKYNYSNMGSASKIKQEKILLPATPAGEPDWKYMEMYMRGVEAMTKEKISLLTKKKQEPIQQTSITNYGTVNIYEK